MGKADRRKPAKRRRRWERSGEGERKGSEEELREWRRRTKGWIGWRDEGNGEEEEEPLTPYPHLPMETMEATEEGNGTAERKGRCTERRRREEQKRGERERERNPTGRPWREERTKASKKRRRKGRRKRGSPTGGEN